MKIHNGFISNSSSSSFIIINAKRGYSNLPIPSDGILIVDNHLGETEFGWGPGDCRLVGDRIIFSYLQTQYADVSLSDIWLDMLEDCIKKETGCKVIDWRISLNYETQEGYAWGYIDHQSSAGEGCNTEMFMSYDNLRDFLFGKDSLIHLDNDNY